MIRNAPPPPAIFSYYVNLVAITFRVIIQFASPMNCAQYSMVVANPRHTTVAPHPSGLANKRSPPHAPAMFVVTEADADAIRAVYEQRGEFAGRDRAAPALPRHYRQRAGTEVGAHHRRLEAAAAATGEADAQGAAGTSDAMTRVGCRH